MRLIRKNAGQAVVETALILPVILLVLFAIFEFGRIFNAELVLTNASREGARKAVVGASDGDIVNTIDTVASVLDTSSLQVIITPESGSRVSGAEVEVEVRYSVQLVTPVISSIVPNPFPLSSKTVMSFE